MVVTTNRPWVGEPPSAPDSPWLYEGLRRRRCIAYLIDVLLIAVLGIGLWFALSVIGVLTLGLLAPAGAIVLALWPLAYHSLFLALRGATPGMRIFGLVARNWDGRRVTALQAVVATLLFYLSVGVTAWLILLVALFNDRARTVHDILSNTLIVRSPR